MREGLGSEPDRQGDAGIRSGAGDYRNGMCIYTGISTYYTQRTSAYSDIGISESESTSIRGGSITTFIISLRQSPVVHVPTGFYRTASPATLSALGKNRVFCLHYRPSLKLAVPYFLHLLLLSCYSFFVFVFVFDFAFCLFPVFFPVLLRHICFI